MFLLKVGPTAFRLLRLLSGACAIVLVACSGTATIDGGGGAGATGSGANGGTGAGMTSTTGGTGGVAPGCECDAPYFPVCGIDGQTHDAACGLSCVPVEVDCEGECPCDSCADMSAAYRSLVQQLKLCDSSIDVPQCTTKVPHELICGCNTFINPSDDATYQALLQLIADWEASNCETDIQCEACAPDPLGAKCDADAGRVDRCVDLNN